MRLYEFIKSRSASLYHGTSYFNATHIIMDNAFRDKTEQDIPGIGVVTGVSFTRNRRFATEWGWIVFELDQNRLAHRHKLIPINYWRDTVAAKLRTQSAVREEAEEFVIGPISDADRYIVALHMSHKRLQTLHKLSGPRIEFYDPILKHPLLKIS